MKEQENSNNAVQSKPENDVHLIELMRVKDSYMAHNAINILKNEGIDAIIDHELLRSSGGPMIGDPSLSIIVKEHDYDKALMMMRKIGYMPTEDMTDENKWSGPFKIFSGKSLTQQILIITIAIIVLLVIMALYVYILHR